MGHYLHPIPGWDIINNPSQNGGKNLKKKILKKIIYIPSEEGTSQYIPSLDGGKNISHPRMGHYLHPIPGWDMIYIPSQDGGKNL